MCEQKRKKEFVYVKSNEFAVNWCDKISTFEMCIREAGYCYCVGGDINGKFTIRPKVTGSKVFEIFVIRETREKKQTEECVNQKSLGLIVKDQSEDIV